MKKQRIRSRLGGNKIYYLLLLVLLGCWLLIGDDTMIDSPWQIELRSVDRQPLPAELRTFILATAQTTLAGGRHAELQETVARLADDPRIADAQLLKNDRQRVAIFVDVHRPLLAIKVNGQWHYLSAKGKIYAVAEQQNYPQLLGILADDGYLLDSEGLVIVDRQEQQIIAQAIELFTTARAGGLPLQKLFFENHRGFRVKITGSETEIFLGNAPFTAKLHKLREILVSLQARNRQATRIELDYVDKAFIKEKT